FREEFAPGFASARRTPWRALCGTRRGPFPDRLPPRSVGGTGPVSAPCPSAPRSDGERPLRGLGATGRIPVRQPGEPGGSLCSSPGLCVSMKALVLAGSLVVAAASWTAFAAVVPPSVVGLEAPLAGGPVAVPRV